MDRNVMKKTILLFLISLLLLPAYSKSGLVTFDEYLKSQNIPIDGVSGTGSGARIDFKNEATAEQRAFANDARATFDWSDKPAPNPTKFLDALTDQIINGTIDVTAVGPIILLHRTAADPVKTKALWQKISADLKLTAKAKSAIETAAQEAEMPLK